MTVSSLLVLLCVRDQSGAKSASEYLVVIYNRV